MTALQQQTNLGPGVVSRFQQDLAGKFNVSQGTVAVGMGALNIALCLLFVFKGMKLKGKMKKLPKAAKVALGLAIAYAVSLAAKGADAMTRTPVVAANAKMQQDLTLAQRQANARQLAGAQQYVNREAQALNAARLSGGAAILTPQPLPSQRFAGIANEIPVN